MHFARFSLSLQHDVRNTIMDEIEKNNQIVAQPATQSLIQDLRQIIEQARGYVAATANYELTMMYWHIGERINREVLDNQRAEYGKQIVATVSRQLQTEFDIRGLRKNRGEKIGDGSDDPQKIMVPLHREYKIGRYEGYRITRNRACMS